MELADVPVCWLDPLRSVLPGFLLPVPISCRNPTSSKPLGLDFSVFPELFSSDFLARFDLPRIGPPCLFLSLAPAHLTLPPGSATGTCPDPVSCKGDMEKSRLWEDRHSGLPAASGFPGVSPHCL